MPEVAAISLYSTDRKRNRHRILIVEDEPNIQVLLRDALQSDGHDVMVASDCSEALVQFDRMKAPEVIVLDLMLPGMPGLKFLEVVRRRYPLIKTVVISAHHSVDNIVKSMSLGAMDFIRKPFRVENVRIAVNEALQFRELQMELEHRQRKGGFPDDTALLYNSNAMAQIMETIQQVAATDIPVFITGESGVGKEVIAREIHHRSQRVNGPFVKVNCAAIPPNLLEGELFGYERGAFTGAVRTHMARFEKADSGTLFLDEIAELELGVQAKFLHVLQDGTFQRLGSNRTIRSNSRIIVATNRDIEKLVKTRVFRPDLYFRLNVIRIHVPPLRERRSDILPLADHFLAMSSRKFGKFVSFDEKTRDFLLKNNWPGNVRELQNAVSRYVVLGRLVENGNVTVDHPALPRNAKPDEQSAEPEVKSSDDRGGSGIQKPMSLKEIAKEASLNAERTAILTVLNATRWNKTRAAKALKISYKALLYKIRDCGIEEQLRDG